MAIPTLDLKAQYATIREEIQQAVNDVLESQYFILGPEVEALEREVAEYCGAGFGIGVSSGTDALLISLMALDVGPGDLVLTTPYTFFATAGSIVRLGARPVFADIDPQTYNLSPACAEETIAALSSEERAKLKALIPVHLFGRCADMNRLNELATATGMRMIEDAAQAIGSEYKGRAAGSMGDLGCFSFFPSKNLGGLGDGGMVVTSDETLATKVEVLRVHGSAPKYYHALVGGNFRLDAIQAAALRVKLPHLDGWSAARAERAATYATMLTDAGIASEDLDAEAPVWIPPIGPADAPGSRCVWNQFAPRVQKRDELAAFLKDKGVATAIYYPLPLHRQECFADLGYGKGDFPESEQAASESLALPMFPELSEEQQGAVVEAIREFYAG